MDTGKADFTKDAWGDDLLHKGHVFVTSAGHGVYTKKIIPLSSWADKTSRDKRDSSMQKKSKNNAINEFLETTTISAISQVNSSRSIFVKAIWVILFGIGLGMSIFQTYLLLKSFLRFSVVERSHKELQYPVEFPSVTVCSNLLLFLNEKALESSIVKECMKGFKLQVEKNEPLPDSNIILQMTSHCSVEARKLMSVPVQDLVLICQFGDLDCRGSLLMTHSLKYGSCATFNPHFMQRTIPSFKERKVFRMLLQTFEMENYADLNHETSVMTLIHTADTAPVMDETRLVQMLPGDWWELNVAKQTFIRKPWPYASQCVERDSPQAQWLSLYQSENIPYMYTMEACTDSCLQNLSLTYCNCYKSDVPLKMLTGENEIECPVCSTIPKHELLDICGCKKPCLSYDYAVHQVSNPYKFTEEAFQKSFIAERSNSPAINYSSVTGFSLEIMSNFVEVTEEEAETDLSTLLGSVGGVFGLWIGFSMMSVFEVLSALAGILVVMLKKFFKF